MSKKTAIVTGGAGDIGREICETLYNADYDVVSLDIIPLVHNRIASIIASVTDREALVDQLLGVKADVLVNAAGITRDKFLHKMDPANWDKVIDINLTGAFNVTRALIGGMRERSYGRIVNIGSVNGCKGQAGQANYSATKAGLHGFTMALAQEGARKNIMVNTISPGYIDTQMTQAIDPVVREDIIKTIPVGHMGTTADISRTVLFLVDEKNTYLTGANLQVNGGLFTSF